MHAVLLALAIVSATAPPVPSSTAYLEEMDEKWVTITYPKIQTLSGKRAFMRLKMTRRNFCPRRGIFDAMKCADFWTGVSPSDHIAADEIEVTNGEGFTWRFSQENYCAIKFAPQPYDEKMCDVLWDTAIEQFSNKKEAAD